MIGEVLARAHSFRRAMVQDRLAAVSKIIPTSRSRFFDVVRVGQGMFIVVKNMFTWLAPMPAWSIPEIDKQPVCTNTHKETQKKNESFHSTLSDTQFISVSHQCKNAMAMRTPKMCISTVKVDDISVHLKNDKMKTKIFRNLPRACFELMSYVPGPRFPVRCGVVLTRKYQWGHHIMSKCKMFPETLDPDRSCSANRPSSTILLPTNAGLGTANITTKFDFATMIVIKKFSQCRKN